MEINLHGRERADAYIEICRALDECLIVGDNRLTMIHGYHHGVSLQSYVRSNKFLAKLKKANYKVKLIPPKDPAKTSLAVNC